MLGIPSRKERQTLELVLDIRSASVGASIVAFGSSLPTVLYTIRVPIAATAGESGATLLPAMLTALKTALETVQSTGLSAVQETHSPARIKQTTVTFGAPWYVAKVKDIVLKQEQPFILTRKKFDTLLEEQVAVEKEKNAGHTMIEHDVTHVVINGYELQDPFNKKTKEIKIALYASFVDTETLTKVRDTIDAQFHRVHVTFRTFPIVLFTTLRSMFWNIDRFTYFDVGGLITDIGVIDNGAITHIASIPFGTQHILKEVQASCALDPLTTASTVAMLERGELHPSCNQDVREALVSAKKNWLLAVQKLVDEQGLALPQRVFVTVDGALLPVFKQIFSAPETRKNIFATDQELQLAVLSLEHFRKHIGGVSEMQVDPFTILTTVFLQATR